MPMVAVLLELPSVVQSLSQLTRIGHVHFMHLCQEFWIVALESQFSNYRLKTIV